MNNISTVKYKYFQTRENSEFWWERVYCEFPICVWKCEIIPTADTRLHVRRRHDMETFSVLLALCVVDSHDESPLMQRFRGFFVAWGGGGGGVGVLVCGSLPMTTSCLILRHILC